MPYRVDVPAAAWAATCVMTTLALAGCSSGSDAPDTATVTPDVPAAPSAPVTPAVPAGPRVIASNFKAPWSIAFHGTTPLVSERDTARILALDAAGMPAVVATIAGVNGSGEGGLLGIAVHDGYLYAYFSAGASNRIERYRLDGSAANLRLGAAQIILDGIPAASIHNGGRIAFGPDGMLYAAAGDAGNRAAAQDLASLGGKILRIRPEGGVPADNPFPGSYVYSYGHRNPQGLAWAADGTLYASEFGQNTWDELNRIQAGGNYGWPTVEGRAGDARFIDPLQQWATGEASPSGMAFSQGNLYIANLRGQRLRQVPVAALGSAVERYVGQYGRLRDVVAAPDGSLWMLTNNTDGRGTPGPGDDRIVSVPAL
jgi:glucose/arabinose dehydrogenase